MNAVLIPLTRAVPNLIAETRGLFLVRSELHAPTEATRLCALHLARSRNRAVAKEARRIVAKMARVVGNDDAGPGAAA